MKIIEKINDLHIDLDQIKTSGKSIGFVPTMGALHYGHLSLIEQARNTCDVVVVSIFVNPAQFGPKEDLEKYPRDLDKDAQFCKEENVDILFYPSDSEMYDFGFDQLKITYPTYTQVLCGKFRPGHFDGVLLIMAKLLNIVDPHFCFMGHKDGQQLILVEKLVKDLNFRTEIIGCPTLREASGLAMSSRNIYLSEPERELAEMVNKALETIVSGNLTQVETLISTEKKKLRDCGLEVQYLSLVDTSNLREVSSIGIGKFMLCVAVLCGSTRLIDNYLITQYEEGKIEIDRGRTLKDAL